MARRPPDRQTERQPSNNAQILQRNMFSNDDIVGLQTVHIHHHPSFSGCFIAVLEEEEYCDIAWVLKIQLGNHAISHFIQEESRAAILSEDLHRLWPSQGLRIAGRLQRG